jgi:hypothetical protein
MRTIVAAITVEESGTVMHEVYTDETTYRSYVAPNNYGAPYLGSFETSEEWRSALGRYATMSAKQMFGLDNPHGERLAYVSPQCSLYVFEVDFDS